MNNYTVYHLHTMLSLLDSATSYKEYIDKAKELGMSAIAFSEHGNIFNYIEKKLYCDKKGIKYLHACEVYLTEQLEPKVRDNYHTILIARNSDGFRELNTLIDLSTQKDHFYYKPRISFDEFLNISDNIIKISACLASPLSRLDEHHPYFYHLAEHYDFYEVQPHQFEEQSEYNIKLYELSKILNKPLIAGSDTHSISSYKAECRSILQKAKGIEYANEDTFDLSFKSYDEFIEMFRNQNSLPEEVFLQAIHNTNLLIDLCEDIQLDLTYKYPKLYEDDEKQFEKAIYDKYLEKITKDIITGNKRYLDNIKEELKVFKKLNMCSFMLFMSELATWCRENDIPIGYCRGSVGGSTIAYILDIIDVDPVKWNTIFSRFANEDRLEIGDIDLDFAPADRERVFEYIVERFGYNYTSYILSIGTIVDKGTIDEIGRALNYNLTLVEEIKREYSQSPDLAKEKYPELFYYFDGLLNCAISQSMHPAGIVVSPLTLFDNFGTFWNDDKRIMQINMEEIHEINLVKYDILGLNNIGIIKETYQLINSPYLYSHEVDWEDKETWDDIITSPVGVFQFESPFAFSLLQKYKPQRINDLSLINASLRPSGMSYRNRLVNREFNKNPSEQIDELLKENNGFLVFQEDTLKFLIEICGFSGSEADNVRRAIARKQRERLDKALPKILDGYCSKSNKPREIAEKEVLTFLQILEDSADYQFGYNHSTGYSMIGYTCAYLRCHHPLEFITAFLNNPQKDEDIANGTQLAKLKNIKIIPPTFRYSSAYYTADKEHNSIYKGISSIKYLNKKVSEELYNLRDNHYKTFTELLVDITEHTSADTRQIEILILLDYFREFGNSKKLIQIYEKFSERYNKKHVDKTKAKRIPEIIEFEKSLPNSKFTPNEKIKAEIKYLGYAETKIPKLPYEYCMVVDFQHKYTHPLLTLYHYQNGETETIKVKINTYKELPVEVFDSIKVISKTLENRWSPPDSEGKFHMLDEKEWILKKYVLVE